MKRILMMAVIASLLTFACNDGETVSPTATTGTPLATSTPQATATPAPPGATAEPTPGLLLRVLAPANESVVRAASIEVRGKSAVDAVVSVDGQVAELDAEGNFIVTVILEPGPNTIDIVASDFQGQQQAAVLTVIYNP